MCTFTPIGLIRTPFTRQEGTPIQPIASRGAAGTIEIFAEYRAGLQDLQGFERIWLLYWFDRAAPYALTVIPYRDIVKRGLFATRAPSRPNPIGISAVRLHEVDVEAGLLQIEDVDILNGTPLLDIKPYVPEFDCYPGSQAGWLEELGKGQNVADSRFSDDS